KEQSDARGYDRKLQRQSGVCHGSRKRHRPRCGAGVCARGASVVVADVSERGNQETARMIEEFSGRALAVRCDVTRTEDVKAALDKAVEAFGRLDFAFNNAGVEQATAALAISQSRSGTGSSTSISAACSCA